MAIEDQVAKLQRDASAVGMAIDAQKIARAGIDAMEAVSGTQGVMTGVFVGTHGMLLAHAVRTLVVANQIAPDAAIAVIMESAKASLALNFTPWSSADTR